MVARKVPGSGSGKGESATSNRLIGSEWVLGVENRARGGEERVEREQVLHRLDTGRCVCRMELPRQFH